MGWLEDVMGRLQAPQRTEGVVEPLGELRGMQGRGWAGNNPMAQQLNRGPQMGDQGGFGRMMQERGGWGQGGQQFQMPQFQMPQQAQGVPQRPMMPPQGMPPQGFQGFQGQPQPQPQSTPQPMATAGMGMNEMTGRRIPQPSSSLSTGLKMGAPARSGGFGI